MSVYQIAMLALIAGASGVSYNRPRAVLWLLLIAITFLASSEWWRQGWPRAELFAGICDTLICTIAFRFAREKWEAVVWNAYVTSVAVNAVYLVNNLTGGPMSHDIYSIILELLNVVAIITIGGTSAFDLAGMRNGRAFHPWRSVLGITLPAYRKAPRNEAPAGEAKR